jgi:hypothetical protein
MVCVSLMVLCIGDGALALHKKSFLHKKQAVCTKSRETNNLTILLPQMGLPLIVNFYNTSSFTLTFNKPDCIPLLFRA